MLEYSKDELAAPLRALEKLRQAISDGRFDPDLTRAGMWAAEAGEPVAPPAAAEPEAAPGPVPVPALEDERKQSSSSSSGDGPGGSSASEAAPPEEGQGTSSSEEAPDLRLVAAGPSCALPLPHDAKLAKHRLLGAVHVVRPEEPGLLRCGRSLSEMILPAELPGGVAPEGRVCAVCRAASQGARAAAQADVPAAGPAAAAAGSADGPPAPAHLPGA